MWKLGNLSPQRDIPTPHKLNGSWSLNMNTYIPQSVLIMAIEIPWASDTTPIACDSFSLPADSINSTANMAA